VLNAENTVPATVNQGSSVSEVELAKELAKELAGCGAPANALGAPAAAGAGGEAAGSASAPQFKTLTARPRNIQQRHGGAAATKEGATTPAESESESDMIPLDEPAEAEEASAAPVPLPDAAPERAALAGYPSEYEPRPEATAGAGCLVSEAKQGANVHVITEDLAGAVASYVLAVANRSIAATGRFTVALSGGSMPKVLGAGLPALDSDWSKWHVFFSDERCVALEDDDSNYKACNDSFLSKVGIPAEQIYTIDPTLVSDPEAAAAAYRQALAAVFGDDLPAFDLMMLGMGPDGHTASLFPGHPLVQEAGTSVASITDSPKPPATRITLTLPVLNNSTDVCFIATGGSKAELLPDVFSAGTELPCGLVQPSSGNLHWFVDADASAQCSIVDGKFVNRL
jgi:6-phosphogluconolactonase